MFLQREPPAGKEERSKELLELRQSRWIFVESEGKKYQYVDSKFHFSFNHIFITLEKNDNDPYWFCVLTLFSITP